ncbi:alpha/beta hydrolase family protein [Corallococcus sp. RDP092CA]|uniref:alpha/beta hydrolase family protein n=1 Tax=Corallococcus sp. RDP092CA TaxID=3109369 RepID=UPI0035AFB9F6
MPTPSRLLPHSIVLAVSVGCVLLGGGREARAQGPASPEARSDGALVARQPCQLLHRTYAQFVSFMREGEPALQPEVFQRVFTRQVHDALVGGTEVVCEKVEYLSDGLRVKGVLVRPRGGPARVKHPAVIYLRGGFGEAGRILFWNLMEFAVLARRGYVVVATEYRGNHGGEGHDEAGGADVRDVLNLIPLLEGQPDVDASRIGLYGWSRGALMAYLTLARTERIAAAVVGAAPTDAFRMVAARPELETEVLAKQVPGYAANRASLLQARSPSRWAELLPAHTPLLLLQGTADWRVAPDEALTMAQHLLAARRPFRLVLFEGGDHLLNEHAAETQRLVGDWLDRYVRDRAPFPPLEPHGR